MSKNGKAITDAMSFILAVGEQCESLFNVFKSELIKPLWGENHEAPSWKKSSRTMGSGLLNVALAWTTPLKDNDTDEDSNESARLHLGFQINFISNDEAGGLSPEPLIHINLWKCATSVSGDDYMGFPMWGFSDQTLEALKDDQARLLRWSDDKTVDERTFSLRLADINNAADVQNHIVANIVGLLNNDQLKNSEKIVVWKLGCSEQHCEVV